MGMSKERLEFQLQQETQKAISALQNNMQQLDKILQIIDANMRQSHMSLLQDITRLTVRVNFLLSETRLNKTVEETEALEVRFKAFAECEQAKMQKEVTEAIKIREAKEAETAAAEEAKSSVIQ
jgi:hypothetical protein